MKLVKFRMEVTQLILLDIQKLDFPPNSLANRKSDNDNQHERDIAIMGNSTEVAQSLQVVLTKLSQQ
jgi:hypothetical protein